MQPSALPPTRLVTLAGLGGGFLAIGLWLCTRAVAPWQIWVGMTLLVLGALLHFVCIAAAERWQLRLAVSQRRLAEAPNAAPQPPRSLPTHDRSPSP